MRSMYHASVIYARVGFLQARANRLWIEPPRGGLPMDSKNPASAQAKRGSDHGHGEHPGGTQWSALCGTGGIVAGQLWAGAGRARLALIQDRLAGLARALRLAAQTDTAEPCWSFGCCPTGSSTAICAACSPTCWAPNPARSRPVRPVTTYGGCAPTA